MRLGSFVFLVRPVVAMNAISMGEYQCERKGVGLAIAISSALGLLALLGVVIASMNHSAGGAIGFIALYVVLAAIAQFGHNQSYKRQADENRPRGWAPQEAHPSTIVDGIHEHH